MCTLRYLLSYWLISHLVMRTWALAINGGTLEKKHKRCQFQMEGNYLRDFQASNKFQKQSQKVFKKRSDDCRDYSPTLSNCIFRSKLCSVAKKTSFACYLIFFANKLSSSSGKAEIIQLRLFASSSFPRKKFKTLEVNLSRLLRSEDSNFCSSNGTIAIALQLCLSKEAVGTDYGMHQFQMR